MKDTVECLTYTNYPKLVGRRDTGELHVHPRESTLFVMKRPARKAIQARQLKGKCDSFVHDF